MGFSLKNAFGTALAAIDGALAADAFNSHKPELGIVFACLAVDGHK